MGSWKSDDDLRRVNLIYLGPPGHTLPFHARYIAWFLFMGLYPVFLGIAWVLPLPLGVTLFYPFLIDLATTYFVMQRISHDRNVRNVVDEWKREWQGRRRFRGGHLNTETVALSTRHVRVHDETPGARTR